MTRQVDIAKTRLYGKDGLKTKNFKMFPGSRRDIAAEEIAEQLNKAISQVQAGDYEEELDDADD